MHTITQTMTGPAQDLKGVAFESDPDCFGPVDFFNYDAPADRKIVSVWVENRRVTPVTMLATAVGIDGHSFTVPPRSAAYYDVPSDIVATRVRAPGMFTDGVRFASILAPL